MKKILLIEDRSQRQKLFENETGIKLKDYENILENKIEEEYRLFVSLLQSGDFDFTPYQVIISHKSAFGDDNILLLDKLKQYCKSSQKILVLFSGGLSSSYYDDNEFIHIELNSKLFYSQNLELFLQSAEQSQEHIMMLSYGKYWKVNILLNVLEKINYFININQEEDILYEEFSNEVELSRLNQLNLNQYQPKIDGNWIDLEEIFKLRDNIKSIINIAVLDE